MNLSERVTSLDLSKKLKEVGVNKECFFYWVKYRYYGCMCWDIKTKKQISLFKKRPTKIIKAYTSFELGNMLRKGTWIEIFYHSLEVQIKEKNSTKIYTNKTEVNTRAKMIIDLKEVTKQRRGNNSTRLIKQI